MRLISIVTVFAMFAAAANANPKHIVKLRPSWGLSPSWDPSLEFSKNPCKGDVRKAVIAQVDAYVMKMPTVFLRDDELLLKVGKEWVGASAYSTESDGSKILDPITGYWKLDDATELHISVLRHVSNLPNGDGFTKMVTVALSVVKNRGAADYCYERWTGAAEVLQ